MEKIVWESNTERVNNNFNYMISNYYSSFTFKYNWNNNKLISDYLKRLFIDSFINDESIRKDLPYLIHNIEDYFETGINNKIFTKDNIVNVYKRLKDGFRTLVYTDRDKILSDRKEDKIYINRDLRLYFKTDKENSLSPVEFRKIYLYREMNKVILNIKDDPYIDKYISSFESVMDEKKGLISDKLDKSLINDGFIMIEDLLAQNLAEYMTYLSCGKERPIFTIKLIDNYPAVTNLADKALFQKPVTSLGKSLVGISNKSDTVTLLNMTKLALESSLVEAIIMIYKEGTATKYYDLFILLQNFGVLKREENNKGSIYKVDLRRVNSIIDTIINRNLNSNIINISNLKPLNFEEYLNA